MNFSYWEQQIYFSDVDVVVVGSGIVGLNTALQLKQKNPRLKVLVLEKGVLPNGASTKNAGFACFGSISEILSDLETASENDIFSLIEKRWKGLQLLRKILGDHALQFEEQGGYELFDDENIYEKCAEKIADFNKKLKTIIGKSDTYKKADGKIVSFGFKKVNHLIFNKYEGQIDIGKMMQALLQKVRNSGIEILNGIKVLSIQPGANAILVLDGGFILRTKKVIVTTNAFAKELLPELDVIPARGQVLVTSVIPHLPVSGTFHYDRGFYYFRNVAGRILLGGGRNLDIKKEETTKFGMTNIIQDKLEEMLVNTIIPNQKFSVDYRWSGIMGFGTEKAPIVKKVSENVFCAVNTQGMGVAIGSLVGEEAAELILKDI